MTAGPPDAVGAWIASILTAVWTPAQVPRIGQWVLEQRVIISSKENATYKGQVYDFSRFPAVAKLVFAFFEDPTARELFVMKHVQTAFTTAAFFAVGHQLVYDPGNVIYVMDTRDKAREKLRDNLKPIFRQIPQLDRADETPETDSTSTALRFDGGVLYIGGGHSTAALNSTAATIVVLDECERHKIISGTSTISLARDRLTGAENSKLLAFSKPEQEARFEDGCYITEEGTLLHAEYLSGDQRKYLCTCPHCGTRQEAIWQNIRFDHCNEALPGHKPHWNRDRILRETYYQCPHCSGHIHEGEEKRRFVESGEWEATRPGGHHGRWSAHLNALTDIAFESLAWPNLALRWIDAQGDATKLRAFWNAILGLPEPRQRSVDTTQQHLLRLIPQPGSIDPPPYRIRDSEGRPLCQIPYPASMLDYIGMTCDVQQSCIKFVTRVFLKDGRSLLLDYGRLPDLPDISLYLDSTIFTTLDGGAYRIFRAYVDTGYRTYDVYELILRDPRIDGIRGEGVEARYKGDGEAWLLPCNTKSGRPLYVIYIAASHWERELYIKRIQQYDPSRHRPDAPAIHLPQDIDDDYLHEMTGMHEVWDKDRRRAKWVKFNSQTVVDYGDCEKYFLVMDWNLGARHQPST